MSQSKTNLLVESSDYRFDERTIAANDAHSPKALDKYRVQVEEPVAPVRPEAPGQSELARKFNSSSGATAVYSANLQSYNNVELPKYERDVVAHERFLNFEEALGNQYFERDLQAEFDVMPQETKTKLVVSYSATSAISEVAQECIEDLHAWRDDMLARIRDGRPLKDAPPVSYKGPSSLSLG